MTLITRLVNICLLGCRHTATYLERRPLHGASVMHLVCEDCGHAAPALQRSAREHRRTVRAGAVRQPRAHRQSADVVTMNRERRQSA